jgi:hypothetical protein
MRIVIRSIVAAILALLGTVVLVVAWTAATAVQLAATALIMGGTGHPLSTPPDDPAGYVTPYLNNAVLEFINPAADAVPGTGHPAIDGVDAGDDVYAVITPEQFFPVAGRMTFDRSVAVGLANLTTCVRGGTECAYNDDVPSAPDEVPGVEDEFVVFGYSQSAVIASLLKRQLIADDTAPATSFFLLANPMRPNGGVLAIGPRGLTIPLIGITFHGATPTNSCDVGACMPTVDVAAQYDGLGGDAPSAITNLLAVLNAAAGYILLHGDLQNASFDDALYQGSHGDTDYYLYATERLPILMPFEGLVPSPILTALDAPLRAAIEGAYQRTVNPGVVTGMSLLPFHDPIQTVLNILRAIPTGIDDAFAEATGDPNFRPLGTTPVTSPFGVGGPELPDPPEAVTTSAMRSRPADDAETVEVEVDVETVETETVEADEPSDGRSDDNVIDEDADEEEDTEDTPEPTTSAATDSDKPKESDETDDADPAEDADDAEGGDATGGTEGGADGGSEGSEAAA